jgi:hypothetical protein
MTVGYRLPQAPRGVRDGVGRGNADRVEAFLARKVLDQRSELCRCQKSRLA